MMDRTTVLKARQGYIKKPSVGLVKDVQAAWREWREVMDARTNELAGRYELDTERNTPPCPLFRRPLQSMQQNSGHRGVLSHESEKTRPE
jgi:hypothetical protein